MKLLKIQSKKTYVNKSGVEKHYYNFVLETDNGKRIVIKPLNNKDFAKLDMVAEYVR